MSVSDLNSRHLSLISKHAARYSVRGGTGLTFLMLVLTLGLFIANILITPVEQAKIQVDEQGFAISDEELMEELVDIARPVVEWAIKASTPEAKAGDDEETREAIEARAEAADEDAQLWASYLIDERPGILSAILLILLFSLPFLIVTGAFNQFSGDIQSRGLRYLLLRTERANLFFGRFLGTSLFAIGTMAVLITTISLYVGLKLQIYGAAELTAWSLWGFLAMVVLTLPYVAFCSWVSSSIDSPFGSLTISALVIGAVPLFAVIGRNTWHPVTYVNWLMPWGIQNQLLHDSLSGQLTAYALCLGYTALFLTLGYRKFSMRDL